jgi:hypothetical protein
MVSRAIYAAIVLLILYVVFTYLLPLPHFVWVVAVLIAVVYVIWGDRATIR